MVKISDHVHYIIKGQRFADPFSSAFDSEKMKGEFGNLLSEDERNILDFLIICNGLFKDLEKIVFELFDKLRLSPQDLREFCFIAINKYFLDFTPKMMEQVRVCLKNIC